MTHLCSSWVSREESPINVTTITKIRIIGILLTNNNHKTIVGVVLLPEWLLLKPVGQVPG